MEVVLLRHADAGDSDPARYPDDGLRPLTEHGRRVQHAVARALRRMAVGFDHLLTSPLMRARETAAITADVVGGKDAIEVVPALGDRFSAAALLRALATYGPASRIGCVGHEPHLSEFAAACLDADRRAIIELPKSGIIGLAFEGPLAFGAARLRYVLRPEHLVALVDETGATKGSAS
jgi:phosphohistidine phosphatase